MAVRASKDVAFFLIGGFDVLGRLTQITDKVEAKIEDITALGDTWITQAYVNMKNAEITQEGFFDDAANSVNDALSTGPGVARVLCYGLEGTATGAAFMGWRSAMQVDYQRMFQRGELWKAKASYKTNGVVEQGRLLRPLNPTTTSGQTTGTPYDWATSASGMSAYLQVSCATQITSIAFDILHSSDNITYASAPFGFAAVTPAGTPTAQNKVTTTVVERYTAGRWAFTGASANRTLTFMMGVSRDFPVGT